LSDVEDYNGLHEIVYNLTFKRLNCTRVEHDYYLLHGELKWAIAPVSEIEFIYDVGNGVLLEARQAGVERFKPGGCASTLI